MNEYEQYDTVGLAELLARGAVSADELLQAARTRLERWNPSLNAVAVDGLSFAEAALRKGLPDGPFTGVPFLLKDLGAACPGLPSTDGSRFNPPEPPQHTDNVVKRFLASGLVVAGRTNSPEFGLTTTTEPVRHGPTVNPWNPAFSAGGSSGGAAAAVAAGIVPAAHASDGGGSIRIPASSCGLFGLKPSRGRISSAPLYGDAWSGFSTNHVITRSVRDSAAFLDILQGAEPGDPYAAPTPTRPYAEEVGAPAGALRVALVTEPFTGAPADPRVVENTREAAQLCQELGHSVEEAAPKIDGAALTAAVVDIIAVHTATLVAWLESLHGRKAGHDDLEPWTLTLAAQGLDVPGVRFQTAIDHVHRVGRAVGAFFEQFDLILSPVQAVETPKLGWVDMRQPPDLFQDRISRTVGFTALFNATGCPAMSVPLHWSEDGVPQGTQFAAPLGREDVLLRLAAQLEEARPWHAKRPAPIDGSAA